MLIVYPHGLGDCILLTPILRNYFFNTGKKASVATLERFKTAKFFDNNPYVADILYTKDAWNDYESPEVGFKKVNEYCQKWADKNNHDKVVYPKHDNWDHSKILINFKYCGVQPTSVFTEVFSSSEEVKTANDFIQNITKGEPFGFVQTTTGRPLANLPENYGRAWLKKKKGLAKTIEVGKDFDVYDFSINTQIEIMRRSSAVCLPDSVFFNACGAIGKPVDHVYIAPTWGPRGYNRVRPLHSVKQNVLFQLDEEVLDSI